MNENEDPISEGLAIHHGKPCPYCGEPMVIGRHRPTRDHIFPKRRRGPADKDKILIVCRLCNEDKSDTTIQQFAQNLARRRDPRAPLVTAVIESLGLPSRRRQIKFCRWCGEESLRACTSMGDLQTRASESDGVCRAQLTAIRPPLPPAAMAAQ